MVQEYKIQRWHISYTDGVLYCMSKLLFFLWFIFILHPLHYLIVTGLLFNEVNASWSLLVTLFWVLNKSFDSHSHTSYWNLIILWSLTFYCFIMQFCKSKKWIIFGRCGCPCGVGVRIVSHVTWQTLCPGGASYLTMKFSF